MLMALTLKAVDSVTTADQPPPAWTFGGGTALAIDIGHRLSYDIDAFMDSALIIQKLVPIGNPVTKAICWNDQTARPDYQYPGHYLKLIVKDVGEIDFLGAALLLENATTAFEFEGRTIKRERPAEIIAKKIYHRGSTFKSRDVFDLAGAYLALPAELAVAAASPFLTPEIYGRVKLRIEMRRSALALDMAGDVNPTDFGRSYVDDACAIALEALDFMEKTRLSGP
jgi:hypothetical protein